MNHSHWNRTSLEELGAARQLVQDVLDCRLHHHVARGRVKMDRDRVTNGVIGVAKAASKLSNTIAVRRELGSEGPCEGRNRIKSTT